MAARYYSVHLAFLHEDCAKWRRENWKTDVTEDCKLYKLDRDVSELSQQEIYEELFKRD
jgi:hypothetical protein